MSECPGLTIQGSQGLSAQLGLRQEAVTFPLIVKPRAHSRHCPRAVSFLGWGEPSLVTGHQLWAPESDRWGDDVGFATNWLWDLEQVTWPVWALVFPPVTWE